jgi:hypothetical protein
VALAQTASIRRANLTPAGYAMSILDAEGREIIAYHWHPESISPIDFPHIHLTSRVSAFDVPKSGRPIALGEMHISTGFVTLARVVRMLIEEFDVGSLRGDWRAILAADADEAATVGQFD